MKHRHGCRTVLIALAILVFHAGAFAAQNVKLATLAPKGTSFHEMLKEMGDAWSKAPDGGVKLTIYTDGSLGGEADMVRRMRVGQIQAGLLTVTGLCQIDDSVAVLQNMPMIFRSTEELEYVRVKLQPMFEKKFRDKGFVVLFWGDAGWARFFSKKQGTYPDDFKRMKLFTWAGDTKTTDLWKTAGFQPVELEVTDILTGLNTGLIDVVPSEPYYALAGQFYGPAPHMLDVKWAPLVGGTVITQKSFDAMSTATQKAVLDAAHAAGEKLTAETRRQSDEAIDVMKRKHGLQVHPVSVEIEKVWRDKCEEFYPKIRGSIVPADTFDEVQRLLAEFRAGKSAGAGDRGSAKSQ